MHNDLYVWLKSVFLSCYAFDHTKCICILICTVRWAQSTPADSCVFMGLYCKFSRAKKYYTHIVITRWSIFKTHGNAGLVWRLLRDPIAFSEPLYYQSGTTCALVI
jgi:hypothetical protein